MKNDRRYSIVHQPTALIAVVVTGDRENANTDCLIVRLCWQGFPPTSVERRVLDQIRKEPRRAKVLTQGMDSEAVMERFEAERQALMNGWFALTSVLAAELPCVPLGR